MPRTKCTLWTCLHAAEIVEKSLKAYRSVLRVSTGFRIACGLPCRHVSRSLVAYTGSLKKVLADVDTLFSTTDKNGDGKLEKSEFVQGFGELSDKLGQDAATVCAIWRAYAHAKVAYEGHKERARGSNAVSRQGILHELFQTLDRDDDDKIDKDEFERGMESLAKGARHVPRLRDFSGEADSRNLLVRCSVVVAFGQSGKFQDLDLFCPETLPKRR